MAISSRPISRKPSFIRSTISGLGSSAPLTYSIKSFCDIWIRVANSAPLISGCSMNSLYSSPNFFSWKKPSKHRSSSISG